jgi:hypothetical protein
MGASTFENIGRGKTAREAFDVLVATAKYECGHGGYTGTIAEKYSFTMIPLPTEVRSATDRKALRHLALDYAFKLIDDDDERVSDKWGPAGCLDLGDGEYLFFGWASC